MTLKVGQGAFAPPFMVMDVISAANARQAAFDGNAEVVTEMDALVAYLQMLGTLVPFRDVTPEQVRQQ